VDHGPPEGGAIPEGKRVEWESNALSLHKGKEGEERSKKGRPCSSKKK